jgi:hypothetical protein
MSGVFCANFASSRMCWTPCRKVWCGKCYTPHPLDKFFCFEVTDEDGFDWRPAEERLCHLHTRDGDHLLTPFQCDLCMFHNLQGRNPLKADAKDDLLLCCIRRANLDAVWGRETHTVQATLRLFSQLTCQLSLVGLHPNLPALGPYPVEDLFGARVAVGMLLKSLGPGWHSHTYQQFKTIRKLRAGFSNVYMASLAGTQCLCTIGGDRAKHYLTQCPTQSLWFKRFVLGCLKWMGQDIRQDWAISIGAMQALMASFELAWGRAVTLEEKDEVATCATYAVVAFCGSLRGNEVFLVDLAGLQWYLRELEGEDFILVPLLG